MAKRSLYIICATLISSVAFSFLCLSSSTASAEDTIDTVTITIPVSCTINNNSGSAHNANIATGTYRSEIGTTTFTTFCNDGNGYSIYAIGYSGDTYGNTKMINRLNKPETDFDTGLNTSGSPSSWAMKLTSVSGTYTPTIENGYNNYSVVPATYTKVATYPSVTDHLEGSAFESTYAINIAPTQMAGTYIGKVRYTIVHPNDGAAPTPPLPGLLGISNMQQMTPEICAASTVGDEKQLTDSRDGKSYWVAKLADSKCWMTQNLDHDIDSTKTYTPADTDIPANWTPDKSTYPTSTTTWDTSTNGYNIQQSYDPGNKIWNGATDSSGNTNINNMTQGTDQHYHLGNYYNWGAAVAMNDTSIYTTQYTDVNQSICPKGWMLPKSGNITTAGSFQYLVNQYNWASNSMTNPNMWAAPLYFPLAGRWYGSSYYVAYYGHFWSSVVRSSSSAYSMYGLYNGTVYPANNSNRNVGFSVRCVSR